MKHLAAEQLLLQYTYYVHCLGYLGCRYVMTSQYLFTGLWGADAANLQLPHCRCDGSCIALGPQGHQHRDGGPLRHFWLCWGRELIVISLMILTLHIAPSPGQMYHLLCLHTCKTTAVSISLSCTFCLQTLACPNLSGRTWSLSCHYVSMSLSLLFQT